MTLVIFKPGSTAPTLKRGWASGCLDPGSNTTAPLSTGPVITGFLVVCPFDAGVTTHRQRARKTTNALDILILSGLFPVAILTRKLFTAFGTLGRPMTRGLEACYLLWIV
jgi:hypothetical protein